MLMEYDDEQDSNVDADTQVCGVIASQLEHILVVDDDATQTEILSHLLSKQGYLVSTAKTCKEAESKVGSDRVDLILLDIGMPDGDGLTLCSSLSDTAATSDIPIIIVSGVDKTGVVREARAAGCQFFVSKPYDPNALLLLIQNSISESRDWNFPGND